MIRVALDHLTNLSGNIGKILPLKFTVVGREPL